MGNKTKIPFKHQYILYSLIPNPSKKWWIDHGERWIGKLTNIYSKTGAKLTKKTILILLS